MIYYHGCPQQEVYYYVKNSLEIYGIFRLFKHTILSYFQDNILSDTALVENLETTKRTAAEIQQKVAEAKITSEKIDEAREHYRPAAARASLLYFILNELNTINPVYQFSLKVYNYL